MTLAKLPLLGLAVSVLLATGTSWSHPPDADGWDREFPISISEAEAKLIEIFNRADNDGNGTISTAEFAAAEMPRSDHHRPDMGKRMRRHDAYRAEMHRGTWSGGDEEGHTERRAEHEAAFFEALDSDGDGKLSMAEFDRDHQRDVKKSLMKSRAFEHMDSDGDGVLTMDEFSGRLARLQDLDVDGNGEVSRGELRDGMRARHDRKG